MKVYYIFECERCGKISKEMSEIEKCDADHLGMTLKELEEYYCLQKNVKHWGQIVSMDNNAGTRKHLKDIISELTEFEEKHNIERWNN